MSIIVAWIYAKKEQKKFEINNQIFEKKYEQTLEMIEKLEEKGCIKKSDLIIEECEEHV
jgi:cysteine synthase